MTPPKRSTPKVIAVSNGSKTSVLGKRFTAAASAPGLSFTSTAAIVRVSDAEATGSSRSASVGE
jgi:hypothetical protein